MLDTREGTMMDMRPPVRTSCDGHRSDEYGGVSAARVARVPVLPDPLRSLNAGVSGGWNVPTML
jgi:hypothetical protein